MPDPDNIIRIRPDCPDPDAIKRGGEIIRNKGVVIFPAQTLYGLAADALDPSAIKKIFDLKKRPASKPILVLIEKQEQIPDLVRSIPRAAKILMDRFWPGGLTLVFEASPALPQALTAGTGKIGIRIPAQVAALDLVKAAGRPVTGTSANLSGAPGCSDPGRLPRSMIQNADLLLDAGPLKGGPGSTILDITTDPVTILRKGSVSGQAISHAMDMAAFP